MDHTTRRGRRDAGQGTLHYVGMIAVAAVVVVAVILGLSSAGVAGLGAQAVCRVELAVPGGADGACDSLTKPDGQRPDGQQDSPWYCKWFGLGCPDTGGDKGDHGSGDDDRPWYCRWLGLGCPSGSGGGGGTQQPPQADVPQGLDPDSDLVKTLQSTARGRATLQWLYDHHIPIETKANQQGAVWDGYAIVLGPGYDNAAVIVHETNHAKYTAEGKHADINALSRDAYIHAAIDEEVDGTVQQILAAKEFRDAGHPLDPQPAEAQYDAAYQAAKASGASDSDAQAAGRQAVSDAFYNGPIVTSNTNETYPDYYGHSWDKVHPR